MGLDGGWQHQQARPGLREVERQRLGGPDGKVARLSDKVQVAGASTCPLAGKTSGMISRDVFEPGLGTGNLLPCLLVRRRGEIDMMQRCAHNLESRAQLPKLGHRHGSMLAGHRHIKGARQAILGEQLRHATIERMTVVPTGRNVRERFPARPSPRDLDLYRYPPAESRSCWSGWYRNWKSTFPLVSAGSSLRCLLLVPQSPRAWRNKIPSDCAHRMPVLDELAQALGNL